MSMCHLSVKVKMDLLYLATVPMSFSSLSSVSVSRLLKSRLLNILSIEKKSHYVVCLS